MFFCCCRSPGQKQCFQFLNRWIVIGASREIEFDLRNDMFRHLESLSYSFYQRTRTGDIMARSTNDLNAVRMLLGPGLMYPASTIVFYGRRLGLHALYQPETDACSPSCHCPVSQHRRPVFRTPHSRPLRAHSGDVLRNFRPRSGKFLRRPRHPRLRAGRSRDRNLRDFEPRIHRPQPETRAPDGHALAHARNHARPRHRAGAVDRGQGSAATPHDRRRFRRLQHLHGPTDLPRHRHGMDHQHLPARHRLAHSHSSS